MPEVENLRALFLPAIATGFVIAAVLSFVIWVLAFFWESRS